MKDFQLSVHNIDLLFDLLGKELEFTPILVVSSQDAGTGKWGMARLWRAWMANSAKWMVKNGATMPLAVKKNGELYGKRPFNSDDAHEMFTSMWLLLNEDGSRLSWAKKSHDGMRAATKGERFICMVKHEQWATERGIMLFKPRNSEYSDLEDKANGQ